MMEFNPFDGIRLNSINQFNQSIINDNYEEFLNLIKQPNVSINSGDNRGYLSIHLLASTINPLQYLIELLKFEIIDVNSQTYDGTTVLLLLCKNPNKANLMETIKLLVDNGADINLANQHLEYPIMEAIRTEKYKVVEYLCSKSNINLNVEDFEKNSLIHEAIKLDDLKYLELLLKYNCKIDNRNSDKATPLFGAVFYRNCKAVKRLLEISNEIGLNDYVNISTDDGTSPIMIACQTNCIDCIKCLLDYNANINSITTDNLTIIHFISEFCEPDVLELIIKDFNFTILPNFLDLNDKRIYVMKNPLHLAISASNFNIIKYFIEKNLFSVNSVQLIEIYTIPNLKIDSKLFYTSIGFALSIGTNSNLINYLINQKDASLELHNQLIIPSVYCCFSSNNSIKKQYKLFKQILDYGFDLNKFAKLASNNYFSNFFLVTFIPDLLRKFLNFGIIIDDLFDLDLKNYFKDFNIDFNAIEFYLLQMDRQGLNNLYESFNLIYKNEKVFRFWNFLKSNVLINLTNFDFNYFNNEIIKIGKLFEIPNELKEISLYQFKKIIWQQTKNSKKFNNELKNLNVTPIIKSLFLK